MLARRSIRARVPAAKGGHRKREESLDQAESYLLRAGIEDPDDTNLQDFQNLRNYIEARTDPEKLAEVSAAKDMPDSDMPDLIKVLPSIPKPVLVGATTTRGLADARLALARRSHVSTRWKASTQRLAAIARKCADPACPSLLRSIEAPETLCEDAWRCGEARRNSRATRQGSTPRRRSEAGDLALEEVRVFIRQASADHPLKARVYRRPDRQGHRRL